MLRGDLVYVTIGSFSGMYSQFYNNEGKTLWEKRGIILWFCKIF